jgi:type VI secretion system secreted protein VgrG
MSFLTQKGRFLNFTSKLGKDVLIATRFTGSEIISRPFHFYFELISSDSSITAKDMLHKPVSLEIHHGAKIPRYFHGIINTFTAGAIKNGKREYAATAMPSIGFLQYATNYRIFRDKSSLDIFKEVCKENSISDIEIKAVIGEPPKRAQCTQFNETTLEFLQRILSEDGIFFVFKHTKDKHIMQLANQASIHEPCPEKEIIYNPGGSTRGERHKIMSWHRDYQFYSGKYAHCDFNHKKPGTSLHATSKGAVKLEKAAAYENFQYNGGHEDPKQGAKLAKQRFEAEQVGHDVVNGSSNHTCFSVGNIFDLKKHPNPKETGSYTLVEVHHTAFDESYLAGTQDAGRESQGYENSFFCIPKATPYRSPLLPKPTCFAPQTAIVVGKTGTEAAGGTHTNEFGSIKVRFHWIRRGNEKIKSEPSTAWARVAQSWAGSGYGTFYLPRIGQEVVVQFIDGDPDQPLIMGCVYNGKNKPPFTQPANTLQSGIKTQSKAGSNELRFEDKEGAEEIYVHAQKDFKREIENDEKVLIIKGDHTFTIQKGESTIEAAKAITLKVGSSSLQLLPDEILMNGQKLYFNGKEISGGK